MVNHARVSFHGFTVPLLGIPEDETLQECEDCHDEHDLLQTRLSLDGHFRCDKCEAHDQNHFPDAKKMVALK